MAQHVLSLPMGPDLPTDQLLAVVDAVANAMRANHL